MERKNLMSDVFSNMEANFPKENLCMVGVGNIKRKKLHFLFDSDTDKRGRCEGGGGRLEPNDNLSDLGNNAIILEDDNRNEINKCKGSMTAVSNDNCISSDTSSSHSEDYEPHGSLYYPTEVACIEGFGKHNLTAEYTNNIQWMKENVQDGDPKSLGNVYLDEHQTLPLWVKWRGKWQTGFRCPTIDCPVATLRAKPTHERKKYISIFFPRTRTYSWADMLLVCAIDEFPEPLAYGTHRRWRKLVKDLSTPRRYIMQKLAVAMLNISDQLHTEAVIVDARKTTTWKQFAMEASCCRDYPSLGLMLLKLQRMILPHYISKGWLENSSESWVQRCGNAPSTESIETLTEELVASVLWGKVDELWNAPVQPELGPEWKTWKQEAMKWFFSPHIRANTQVAEHSNPHTSLIGEPQTSRKRVKLEIRRPETSASQIEVTDCRRSSHAENLGTNYEHGVSEGLFKLPLNCEPQNIVALPRVTEVTGSANMFDQGNETAIEGKGVGLESTISAAADGIGCNEQNLHAPDQSNSSNRYRQCLAFIEAKGRQCGRWANDGDIYCCVHLTFHSVEKHPQGDHMLPIEAQMCHGTTTHGNKCKHRARYNLTFCKKHWFQGNHNSATVDTLLLSSAETTQKIQQENQVPEKFSSPNASSGQELVLLREAAHSSVEKVIPITIDTLNEKNVLRRQSDLCNTLPKSISSDIQRCIGQFGHNNGGQCYEFPRRHTLYCEKHLPRFLKRARNGKSRLISKDVFVNLLRSCSGEQKIYLHQACELLYGFLKNSLSSQKFLSKGDNVSWILAEASKDVNVGEYLLKLVCCEREKLTGLWGFDCDLDKPVSSKEINSLSTLNQDFPMIQKCKICAQQFSDDPMLVRHWAEVHKKETRRLFKGYACAVCTNLFTNRKVLETHVIEKHGVQFLEHSILVRCLTCSSQFANPEELWQHVFSFHITELRLPNFNPHNYSLLEDNSAQMKVRTTIKLCQNKSVLRKGDDSQKYSCRFCGLKFDLLPDLSRHHQVAHMIPYSSNRFSSKRGNYFLKRAKAIHSRFWKKMGSAFRFKNQNTRMMLENFRSSSSVSQVKPELYQQPSEVFRFGGLSQSNCCNVAETLFSKIQRTKRRPTTLEILSFARFACCRISLDASLALEYGVLPENIYLKAAKLCSELNIQVSWHQDGFTCPRGCKPAVKSYSLAPLKPLPSLPSEPPRIDSRIDINWEIDECHHILSSEHFDWKERRHSIVLCEDLSFGKEATPVACVIDEDLKHLLTIDVHEDSYAPKSGLSMPWLGYTYATGRLMDPSLDLDAKSSQLGCACPQPKCHPEKCDHVYLFDNDYDNAVDIHGKLMQGRFPYDDHGRILLEEGYFVYECNSMCSCDVACSNRVLQKGVQVKLQVFRKEATKGWGVRAGEFIPGGTFICEYIGVVKPRQEAHGEMHDEHSDSRSYIYDMGRHSDGEPSCLIDATKYGNVSRFINHSCSPNLVNYQVLIESMDSQLAHVGLFAKTDIGIGEELAYDYSRRIITR